MPASDPFSFASSKSDVLTGWTVGGGVEWMLDRNWIARGEYLYESFGNMSVPLAGSVPATSGSLETTAHKLRAGISYKF